MQLSDRFKYIMKLNQLSASAFAEEIGVQRSSVSHVLSGRNKPSLEFIQKVLKRFPKVDANWLVSGATSVEKDQFKVNSETEKSSSSIMSNSEEGANSKLKHEGSDGLVENETKRSIKKILVFYTDGTFEELSKS